jgi:hypothetical protein
MILAGAAAVAGLIVVDPWLRLGLLELGALLTLALVWQSAKTQSAKLTYLAVVLISAVSLVSSDLLLEHAVNRIGRARYYDQYLRQAGSRSALLLAARNGR